MSSSEQDVQLIQTKPCSMVITRQSAETIGDCNSKEKSDYDYIWFLQKLEKSTYTLVHGHSTGKDNSHVATRTMMKLFNLSALR